MSAPTKENLETGRKQMRRVSKWVNRLWLNHWYLFAEYVDKIEHRKDALSNFETTASIECDYTYKKATISFACETIRKLRVRDQERSALHETLHIALSGYQHIFDDIVDRLPDDQQDVVKSWWRQVDEQTTEHMTNVLLALTAPKKTRFQMASEVKDLRVTEESDPAEAEVEAPKAASAHRVPQAAASAYPGRLARGFLRSAQLMLRSLPTGPK